MATYFLVTEELAAGFSALLHHLVGLTPEQRTWKYVDAANNALTAIELHDPEGVVEVARALDWKLVELVRLAREQQWDRVEWRQARQGVLGDAVSDAKSAARRYVGAAS